MISHGAGKVILLGEHAVVYGVPALAVGIDRGARAWLTNPGETAPSCATLSIPSWDISASEDKDEPLSQAFRALLQITRKETNREIGNVTIEADGNLPPGGGLGSSSAVGVAVARALDGTASSAIIERRVMEWERVFHGNPSGVDAAVASRGGCIYFRRGGPVESVQVNGVLHLCVGQSGTASSTKTMVESVAKRMVQNPELVEKSWLGIRSLVDNARLALEAGDFRALGKLLDLNQMILSGLFLSSPELETLCGVARRAGALGAKLTGAGGGGCVIALAESAEAAEEILAAWKDAGFDGFGTRIARSVSAEMASARASA